MPFMPNTDSAIAASYAADILPDIAAYCADTYAVPLETISVISDVPGNGIHLCNSDCPERCYSSCNNSDRIVTMEYGTRGYQSVIGIVNGEFRVWMD